MPRLQAIFYVQRKSNAQSKINKEECAMPGRKKAQPLEATGANNNPEGISNTDFSENSEGVTSMDYEDIGADGDISSEDSTPNKEITQESAEIGTIPEATPASRQRRRRVQTEPSAPVLTLEVGAEVQSQKDKENAVWHEIRNSQITGTHLTGMLGKVERLENGNLISIVDYKGQRIAIPLQEMMLNLTRPEKQSEAEFNERVARVLNRMMGAEIDFVVRGITGRDDDKAAVASRKSAMHRLRRRYYLTNGTNGKPQVYPGRVVEARIVAVSQLAIRVEIFGVETPIRNRDISWGYIGDCRDVYYVGDSVQVRVNAVNGDTPENLSISADIKSLTENNNREKLLALKPQTNCIGKVADTGGGIVFINLVDGIRAIAHKCFDRRKPGRGDDVLFVCSRIDEEGGVAVGFISRIVKRNM